MSAVSTTGELKIYCEGDAGHCQSQEKVLEEVGDAHLVTDVDNDGLPEVFHSARSAPGAGDRVLVMGPGPATAAPLYQKEFQGGILAIAAGDFAGDGALEVVVAVRKGTSKRVTLWLLN